MLPLLLILPACKGSRSVITARGLKFAELGTEMPPAGSRRIKGIPMRDSIAEQGEYSWRVSQLRYKGGMVYLEEDFFIKDIVNRIRIETPELHLKNGLSVGKNVDDLRASAAEWFVVPLPEYKLFDFYTRVLPSIHFLVDDPGHSMTEESWEKYRAEDFNADAKIVAIVVY